MENTKGPRRADRYSTKPKMIGPPAALIYDSEECRYPGLIRVSFNDGRTIVYSAYEQVRPMVAEPADTGDIIIGYQAEWTISRQGKEKRRR